MPRKKKAPPPPPTHNAKWWAETKEMVDRGAAAFWAKRGKQPSWHLDFGKKNKDKLDD